jgi:hypothetical protein
LTAVRLSDRQQFALLALDGLSEPATGGTLASHMTRHGRETSIAAAHQAANGLVIKKLAIKRYPEGSPVIRYEITGEGRRLAAQLREPEQALSAGPAPDDVDLYRPAVPRG